MDELLAGWSENVRLMEKKNTSGKNFLRWHLLIELREVGKMFVKDIRAWWAYCTGYLCQQISLFWLVDGFSVASISGRCFT